LVVVGQRHFSFQDIYTAQSEVGRPVMFLHDVGDHELPILMRHAKLFAYPAYAEGFGMPIIEALASGVPVVTSNTTAMPEIAGTHAILVDPTQVASIRDGLAAGLALSGAEKETVIAAGLAQAAAFNWDSSASVLIDRFRLALQHR
jgi:glycosyltransferase involved in cell wall biosynthesis